MLWTVHVKWGSVVIYTGSDFKRTELIKVNVLFQMWLNGLHKLNWSIKNSLKLLKENHV